MQFIFDCSISNYIEQEKGKEVAVPILNSCPNPYCKINVAPKKHGGYERYSLSEQYQGHIYIHRRYCPYCGKTFSFLPSFCVPYFQYALHVIIEVLICAFKNDISYKKILAYIWMKFNILFSKQHISFYCNRFTSNLSFVQTILRSINPLVKLPDAHLTKNKKAKKVITTIKNLFPASHSFSEQFFKASNQSFLATHHFISV
ncbi:DUF6431 domain-containing protein [Marinisporobacter balticus]|uniref:DUF6431 domain-containing protein n=1 Tax=Marinisporobacter balticus TaxID=2018667 RepID=A0A4V2S9M3_9FIRM|nr:DUF6431 domain-containing protein [Marinisporobacter balticus]TCO67590.1 hypothetical protein EV214_1623 [Marinisporobacter balticus]